MKLLSAILFILILSACVTKKQEANILKKCVTSSSVKDTVWIERTIKLDTTYISIPGPTAYLPNPCQDLCDSLGHLKPFKQVSKKNGITQKLESVGNVLIQDCDVDSLLQVNRTLSERITHLRHEKDQMHDNCTLRHFTATDNFFEVSGKALWIIILLIVIGWAVKKFILKK